MYPPDEITVEIESDKVDNVQLKDNNSLSELQKQYNSIKESDTETASSINSKFTLKGMDEFGQMIADAMIEISSVLDNGKPEGFMEKTSSKALAVLDSKNRWIGKWIGNKSEDIKKEDIKQMTVDKVIGKAKSGVLQKIKEVNEMIDSMIDMKNNIITRAEHYKQILNHTQEIFDNAQELTKEYRDARKFIVHIRTSINKSESLVTSVINPLLILTDEALQEIENQLPSLEEDLSTNLAVKTYQQKLLDLNEITLGLGNLSKQVASKTKEGVYETLLSTAELLGEGGIDAQQLQKDAQQEKMYLQKINAQLEENEVKREKQYNELVEYSNILAYNREANASRLLNTYKPKDN